MSRLTHLQDLESWGFKDVDLKVFRDIFGNTPFFSAGGWNDKNTWGVLEEKTYDAFAIGRLFLSTPDLVNRWVTLATRTRILLLTTCRFKKGSTVERV
jgi:2,4-dienoyl-CoA reductase-like NADH-dependent reductase (Old Yellow Enzyme family)